MYIQFTCTVSKFGRLWFYGGTTQCNSVFIHFITLWTNLLYKNSKTTSRKLSICLTFCKISLKFASNCGVWVDIFTFRSSDRRLFTFPQCTVHDPKNPEVIQKTTKKVHGIVACRWLGVSKSSSISSEINNDLVFYSNEFVLFVLNSSEWCYTILFVER